MKMHILWALDAIIMVMETSSQETEICLIYH